MNQDNFEKQFQRECKVIIVICLFLLLLLIGFVIASHATIEKIDEDIQHYDEILQEVK